MKIIKKGQLNDDQLNKIAGGKSQESQYMEITCKVCGEIFKADVMKDSAKCSKGHITYLYG